MSITSKTDPVDALYEIFSNTKQFNSLTIPSGTTETVPSNEVWIINGKLTVEGTLNVNGELLQADYFNIGYPNIHKLHETTPAGRQNERTDSLYILTSTGTDLNRFGINPNQRDDQTEDGQVQIYVYSLTDHNAKTHAQDVAEYLRVYYSDNYTKTNFLNIEPNNISDRRASSIARQTDHYVYVVDIQTERLS